MEITLSDAELYRLLEEAFDAGWYGSLSLKEETLRGLLNRSQYQHGTMKIVLDHHYTYSGTSTASIA